MPLSRPPVRSSLAVLSGALALLAVPACGPIEDAIGGSTSDVPAGGPPPPGFGADMLTAHNAVRADPSSVGGTPAPSPALAPLSWSDTVTTTAQAWADHCAYQHNSTELQRLSYGENIAATAPAGARDAAYIVGLWASEAPFYRWDTNSCDAGNAANEAHTCGHYTQLVWRTTTVVGCGKQTCTAATWPFPGGTPGPWDFWVCDYAPPGNWVGEKPY